MKTVVITGSTRGIGFAMAKEFLKAGCQVTVSGRREESLEPAREALKAFSGKVHFVPCDVRRKAEVDALWEKSAGHWGKVDIWINNAGINCSREFIFDMPKEGVDDVVDTNLKGMIYGSQIAAKKMIQQGYGQIWNMEGLGSNNMIHPKTILYGTTKHALTYFTEGLAKELKGKHIMAGRLSPGMMFTDFHRTGTGGSPSDISKNPGAMKVLQILGDRPETVAAFLVPRMLENRKNNAHIVWLTRRKSMGRFLTSLVKKRNLQTGEGK